MSGYIRYKKMSEQYNKAMEDMAETSETGINGWSGFSEFYADLKNKESPWYEVWRDGVEVAKAGVDVHKKNWRREMNLPGVNVAREIFALKRTIEGEALFAIGYDTDRLDQAEAVKERAERVLIERLQNYMGSMESDDLRRDYGGNVRRMAEGIMLREYRFTPKNEVMERFVSETYTSVFPTYKPDKEEQVRLKKPVWAIGLVAMAIVGGAMLYANYEGKGQQHIEPTPTPTSGLKSNSDEVAEVIKPMETEVPQPTKAPVASPTPAPTQEAVKPPEVKLDIWGWLKLKAGGQEIDLSKNFSLNVPESAAKAAGKKAAIKVSGEVTVDSIHDPQSPDQEAWAKQFDDWLGNPKLMGVQQGDNMRPIIRFHSGNLWVSDFQGDWVRTSTGEIDPKTGKPMIIGQEIPVEQDGQTVKARVTNVIVVSREAFARTNRWFDQEPGRPMMWDVAALTNKDNILWDGKTGNPDDPAIPFRVINSSGFEIVVCGKPGLAIGSNLDNFYTIMSTELVEPPPAPVDPPRNLPKQFIAEAPGSPKVAVVNYVVEEQANQNVQAPEVDPAHLAGNTLIKDAIQLKDLINAYKLSHTEDDPEKLGMYIRKSPWYGGLSEDKKQKIEPPLRRVDDDTDKYFDPVTGEKQPIQCLRFESLLSALGDTEGPVHNLGGAGTDVVFPGDALTKPEYFGFRPQIAEDVKLENLRKGQLLITKTHVMTVVSSMRVGYGWEVVLADANSSSDGTARVVTVTSAFELPGVLGNVSVWLE